jgi:integrase
MVADTPDLKLVSARLGHSSVSITGDLYTHLLNI